MGERRRYIRIPENLQIFYEIIPSEKVKECATKNISQGGIKFITDEFIPKDSHLKIKVNFYKTLFSFEALVKCVWVREMNYSDEYEVGVDFIDIPPEAVSYLINYIETLLNPKDK